ncbi:MAG: chitobiase/beta-hexosaminidase C-terminal domain-containing protein [Lachnospiraceae bacterium]|nr:chitobiase/beta-hexosaminidase C-terminal domain-containing protein [Lachnospiraceae bacterium]
MWKLYSIAGILCVLMAVVGVALILNRDTQAASQAVGWEVLSSDGTTILPFYHDDAKTPDDIGLSLYKEGDDYVAYITKAEQLEYVFSGLKRSHSFVSGQNEDGTDIISTVTRNADITFKLGNDFEYGFNNSFSKTKAFLNNEKNQYEYSSGWLFQGDTFDGQGHTITLKKKAQTTRAVLPPSLFDGEGGGVTNYGLMFSRVEDAIIRNIRIVYAESPSSFRVINDTEGTHAGGGVGIVCGGADQSVFEDISVFAQKDSPEDFFIRLYDSSSLTNATLQVGVGTIVGCMENSVTVKRCQSDINVNIEANSAIDGKSINWIAGGMFAGQAVGSGNVIQACINLNEEYSYGIPEQSVSGGSSKPEYFEEIINCMAIQGDILGMVGGIHGYDIGNGNVTIQDCILHKDGTRAVGAIKDVWGKEGSGSYSESNTYFLGEVIPKNPMQIIAYDDPEYTVRLNYSETSTEGVTTKEITVRGESDIEDKQLTANDIDGEIINWFYDQQYDLHLLKDNYQLTPELEGVSGLITFAPPKILEPTGANNRIDVQGILQGWNNETVFAVNSRVELYVTTGEESDPQTMETPTAVLNGKTTSGTDAYIVSAEENCPVYSGDPTVVKAILKIILNGNDDELKNDVIFWSGLSTRTYTEIDTMLDKPELSLKKETDTEFISHESSNAYALGTTKWKLTLPDGKNYKMKLFYGDKSGLQIEDPSKADYLDPATITIGYVNAAEMTLSKEMIIQEDSNLIHLYVLAEAEKDGVVKQKLYEYELITFIKDTLLTTVPENNSRIPDGSQVLIQVGNGKEAEYPYKEMRILVSDKKLTKLPNTLLGMTGVATYSDWSGSGTKEDPWYLEAAQKISGSVGSRYYVYAEPVVNKEQTHPDGSQLPDSKLPYQQRYATFVQEYVYTIMDNAAVPSLSPTTVKTTDSGEPTAIAVESRIYITGKTNTDLILYNLTGDPIVPLMISDKSRSEELDARTDVNTMGAIIYCEDDQTKKLYVKCNDVWYEMDDVDADITNMEDESLRVYQDGDLYFDMSHENQNSYVSAIVFADGYGPSSNDVYVYYVEEQGAVAVPIALLAPGSNIAMNRVLHFSSDPQTVIFYTTDGKEPQIQIQDDAKITALGETKLYHVDSGIQITEASGFSYGSTATIKMLACPVLDESQQEAELRFNNKKKASPAVTFTYEIAQQNQVEAPTAYPESPGADPSVVKKGDKIVLNCATSDAEIFFTTDGTVPDENSEKYTNVITADGIYGGYFTVKAFARKAEMKDSEMVSFTFKIADQEVVGAVTATPGTSNTVIAKDKIILSATTPDAQIFYTTDGNVPEVTMTVSGNNISYTCKGTTKQYDPSDPISVTEGSGYFVIKAIAVKPDMADSDVVEFVYTYADAVGAPYGNPSSGTVKANTEVLLMSATKDAVIYYEIAYGETPKDPTQSSPVFSDKAPIVITRDTVIKAFAVYNRESSEIVTLKYTLAQQMAKPSVSTSSGSIVPSGTKIIFSAADGTVYYTTDGSDPSDDQNALVNSGNSVVLTGNPGDTVKVNVCTKKTGATTSEVVTLTYQISQYVGGVTADVESGAVVSKGDKIHLTTDVTGGTIYFTLASGNPITEGIAGNNVLITGEPGSMVILKAVAVAPGTEMTGSYANFQYKMMEQLAAPNGSVLSGTVMTEATNLVLKANKGKIYYTVDGSDPDKNSYVYEYPIVIYKDMVVKAIAVEENYENSEVSIFSYTFAEAVSGLAASKDSGNLQAGEVIWLSADQAQADIYYTTDGSTPDPKAKEGTFLYNPADGIRINRNVSIKAIAALNGMQNSNVLELSYTVDNIPAQEEKQAQKEAEENIGPAELNTEQLEERRPGVSDNALSGNVVLRDFNNGAILTGSDASLSDKMTLGTKEIAISKDAQKSVKNLLGDEYEFLNNYEVTLYLNGKRIQPQGEVEIALPLPDDYKNADVSIIYSNEKGQIQVIETRRENGYAYANVAHLKNFGIVGARVDKNNTWDLNLILLLTACAALLTGLGAVMIIRTKKQEVS